MRRFSWLVSSSLISVLALAPATRAQAQAAGDVAVGSDGDPNASLPAGHPSVGGSGSGHGASASDVFQPPADVEQLDPGLQRGSIAVELHDGDDKPVAGETVDLGILINSIAKGDTHKHMTAVTDALGRAGFSGLETLSNIAYRVTCGFQGGSFAAMPFQIPEGKAMRVVLHVYPVTRDVGVAVIASEVAIEAEPRDDRMQIEEAVTVYNLGRTAWQPDDVRMALPAAHTAFGAQQTMSDQGVDEDGNFAKLRGTFPPGEHSLEFHWQLPMSGDKDIDFDIGLPPHVALTRLLVPAAPGIRLVAADFPPAQQLRDSRGQSFLVTERRIRFDDPRLRSVSMGIHDLPTPGPGRSIATIVAGVAVLAGLFMTARRGGPKGLLGRGLADRKAAKALRSSLLEEIATIERAHTRGTIGPRTYERARRELIDALALTLTTPAKS